MMPFLIVSLENIDYISIVTPRILQSCEWSGRLIYFRYFMHVGTAD